MGGPISFLLGLLMIGGSGASYVAEKARNSNDCDLVDYKHYWEGHPKVTELTGLFREQLDGRMCSLGFGTYAGAEEWIREQPQVDRSHILSSAMRNDCLIFSEKYPQFQKKLFYGPFDLSKLRAELEPKTLYDMLYKWTILEYGLWIHMTEKEWNRIDKYLWSGDYLYEKFSWAKFFISKYPDMYAPYVRDENSKVPSKFQDFSIRKGLSYRFNNTNDEHIYSWKWLDKKNMLISTYKYEVAKKDMMKVIDEYVVGDIESELFAFLQQLDVRREVVPLRHFNDNRFFSLLRKSLNQPRYNISQIPAYDFYDDVVDKFYYNELPKNDYYEYVQMLHQNHESYSNIQVTLKLNQEEFNKKFNDNHYLQLCAKHEKAALEIAEKYEIEEFNLTKWDICQMTKARPTGFNYTILCELPKSSYFIRECGWVPKYLKSKRFCGSDIEFLQQKIDTNKQEFCKLLRENSRFFIDFFKCVFVESLPSQFAMDDLIKSAFEADDYPKKDEQHYKALLQEAIDEYKTWVEIIDTTEQQKPQLKLRQPNVSQN